MKKLFNLLLLSALFCSSVAFADEALSEQGVNENKAVIAVQKQPANKEQKQTATQYCVYYNPD